MIMGTPPPPSYVVIAYDATKERSEHELKLTANWVRLRGDILRRGDTLLVLGVLHRVMHPMGYQAIACPDSFGTSTRALKEEVAKKADIYANWLVQSAEECQRQGVRIDVKITAGTPMKKVILQEVYSCTPTWVILDRHLRRDIKCYLKQIPSKLALIQDSLDVEVLRPHRIDAAMVMEHKLFHSLSKPVSPRKIQNGENSRSLSSFFSLMENNLTSSSVSQLWNTPATDFGSSSKDESGLYRKGENISLIRDIVQNERRNVFQGRSSGAPLLCAACGMTTELYIKDSMQLSFSEIQRATQDFSQENLLGEGGYGHVYKGELEDGQMIAAKVRKEASTQGFAEFHSEVYVLSFARHKNIVMLLGYCCKENLNILVYEYICNKSLYWHLFETTETVLDWHQRRAIAIGTAKGLRFLHEECRGGPIIHRDLRPGNILLTHDYVPMIGDFGLAKWKTRDSPDVQTKILGTLGYLAPEYAESGIVSVRTDVYAFGIVLLQLISGRKVFDEQREDQQQSLREWAESLIVNSAFHELVDPWIEDSYDTDELKVMVKASYMCMQRNPELRPSMGEVVRLLEGENSHFRHLAELLVPPQTKE